MKNSSSVRCDKSHRISKAVFLDSLYIKSTITILVVVSFLLLPKVGFRPVGAEGFDIVNTIVFPLSHANIFHLLCNLLCLWQMSRLRNYLVPAFLVQFVCALLPEVTPDIMGLSGFLFAVVGLKCGYYGAGRRMFKSLAPFFVITAFIPNVAMLYHLYCTVVAYYAGRCYNSYCLWKNLRI